LAYSYRRKNTEVKIKASQNRDMHAREVDEKLHAYTDSNLDRNNYNRVPVVYLKLVVIIGNTGT
jgi:hypothetical protein